MIVARTYVSDLGIAIPYLKMDIAFLGEESLSRKVSDLNQVADIVPQKALQELRRRNFSSCETNISPRFVILNLKNSRKLKLPYPFQPGTADWQVFWNDLLANPQIILAKGTGETLANSFLKRTQ